MRWRVKGVVWRRKLFVGRGLQRVARQGLATKERKEPKATGGGAFFSRQDAKTRRRAVPPERRTGLHDGHDAAAGAGKGEIKS